MSKLFSFCSAVFNGMWRIADKVLTVNYCVVTTIGTAISTAVALLTSVLHACLDIVCYIAQCSTAAAFLLYDSISFVLRCGVLVGRILLSTVAALCRCVAYCIHTLWTLMTTPLPVRKICIAAQEKVLYLIDSTTAMVQWTAQQTCAAFLGTIAVIDSVASSVVTTLGQFLSHVGDLAVTGWTEYVNVISNLLTRSASAVKFVTLELGDAIASTVSKDVVIVVICVSILLPAVVLLCKPYVVRMYSVHVRTNEILLNDADDFIEVSDDEHNEFENNETEDVIDLEDEDDGIDNDDDDDEDVDDEFSIDVSGDESDDGSTVSTDSNVADDDDDDDDDDEGDLITVQLPERPTRRNLRSSVNCPYNESTSSNSLQSDGSSCVICQDQPKSVLVLPCRHLCLCVDCAHTIVDGIPGQRRTCPLCRASIRTIMNVYT